MYSLVPACMYSVVPACILYAYRRCYDMVPYHIIVIVTIVWYHIISNCHRDGSDPVSPCAFSSLTNKNHIIVYLIYTPNIWLSCSQGTWLYSTMPTMTTNERDEKDYPPDVPPRARFARKWIYYNTCVLKYPELRNFYVGVCEKVAKINNGVFHAADMKDPLRTHEKVYFRHDPKRRSALETRCTTFCEAPSSSTTI